MYTSIFGQNRAGHGWQFLSISMASIFMSMAAQAITPEQYQGAFPKNCVTAYNPLTGE